MTGQTLGPVRLYLTDTGVKCVEDFSSDTGGYLERQQYRTSGPTVTIGTNNAPIQIAGDYARQIQNIGTSANDLRQLIRGSRQSCAHSFLMWLTRTWKSRRHSQPSAIGAWTGPRLSGSAPGR